MSIDEQRIVNFLRRLADNYDQRGLRHPFSFDRMKAKCLRGVATGIEQGKHR